MSNGYTPTQEQINMWDMNGDGSLNEADIAFANAIGQTWAATAIRDILDTGDTGPIDMNIVSQEMDSDLYQTYLDFFKQGGDETVEDFMLDAGLAPLSSLVFNAFQSGVSTYSGFSARKRVINWTSFWSDTNIPVIGYDAVDDKLVILKGSDHSADSTKDLLVFDLITNSWTVGDTKLSGTNDMTNMVTAPDTGELVIMHQNNSAANNLKRFKAHQPANISSSTVALATPFFDLGASMAKKRLYKVEVLCHGTNLDDLAIIASYDGDLGGYSNIFSSNTFANTADDGTYDDWDTQTFTVSSPTDFNNVSIKIYSTGAMTTADWGISEIALKYREKGIR